MSRFICDVCGTGFDRPVKRTYREVIDGRSRIDEELLCPICLNDHYSPASACMCGAPIHDGEHLCRRCRADLLQRVTAFADTLTAEEEAQFDDWMDGASIQERTTGR